MAPVTVRRLQRVASALFVLGIVVLAWPTSLGGRSGVVMVSGVSMQPAMHTGDLALLRAKATYDVGDVVAFRIPRGEQGAGAVVIHRVIGGNAAGGYVVQGDNKAMADPWRPTSGDVIGARWGLVPRAGAWLSWLREPIRLAALASALTVFAVVAAKPPADRPGRRRRRARATLVS